MKSFVFKLISIFLSIFLSYILIFFYFYNTLEKDFKDNFKNSESLFFYKKYSKKMNHLRYNDGYRSKNKKEEMIYNIIKNESDKKIILFQGDSWINQINTVQGAHNLLKKNLTNFSKIINAGVTSYSPSLMNVQFNIMEKDFKIKPNVVVIYVDQTDMGDELCRYKNLLSLDNSENLLKVGMEEFPLYQDVFNLHEKITFSEIELKEENKIIKTQLYINYKIKKSLIKTKKRFDKFLNKSRYTKCGWRIIENYKVSITDKEKEHFQITLKRLFSTLEKKKFIEKIFVVTHPHRLQLTTKKYPVDVSDIVSESIINFKKIEHINFSKILKENQKFYENFDSIWIKDDIHLNGKNYKKFLNRIIQTIEG